MKKYIAQIFVLTFVFILIGVGTNLIVDPLEVFGAPKIQGVNTYKRGVTLHERLCKTLWSDSFKPDTLLVGTSRVNQGFDPKVTEAAGLRSYNVGTSAQAYKESYQRVVRAYEQYKVKSVILALDFKQANTFDPIVPDPTMGTPSWKLSVKTLVSIDTLFLSAYTVWSNVKKTVQYRTYDPQTGLCLIDPVVMETNGGYYENIRTNHRLYIQSRYRPPPRNEYEISENNPKSPVLQIRNLLRFAYANGIQVKILFTPFHVQDMEVISGMGLWDQFEAWKRKMVQINEEEAAKANQKPFDLWDFTVYSKVTTEPLPITKDSPIVPKYYWETSHFKLGVGTMVLQKVLNITPKEINPDSEGFGQKIDASNIDQHLAQVRADHLKYREQYPDQVKYIEELVKQYAPKPGTHEAAPEAE